MKKAVSWLLLFLLVFAAPAQAAMFMRNCALEQSLYRENHPCSHNGDYGTTTQTSGDHGLYQPMLYTHCELDGETGFYHNRARHYAPKFGKFLARDPIASNNLYSYCHGDPINFSDPSGNVPVLAAAFYAGLTVYAAYDYYSGNYDSRHQAIIARTPSGSGAAVEDFPPQIGIPMTAAAAVPGMRFVVPGSTGRVSGSVLAGSRGLTAAEAADAALIPDVTGGYRNYVMHSNPLGQISMSLEELFAETEALPGSGWVRFVGCHTKQAARRMANKYNKPYRGSGSEVDLYPGTFEGGTPWETEFPPGWQGPWESPGE